MTDFLKKIVNELLLRHGLNHEHWIDNRFNAEKMFKRERARNKSTRIDVERQDAFEKESDNVSGQESGLENAQEFGQEGADESGHESGPENAHLSGFESGRESEEEQFNPIARNDEEVFQQTFTEEENLDATLQGQHLSDLILNISSFLFHNGVDLGKLSKFDFLKI